MSLSAIGWSSTTSDKNLSTSHFIPKIAVISKSLCYQKLPFDVSRAKKGFDEAIFLCFLLNMFLHFVNVYWLDIAVIQQFLHFPYTRAVPGRESLNDSLKINTLTISPEIWLNYPAKGAFLIPKIFSLPDVHSRTTASQDSKALLMGRQKLIQKMNE